MDERSRVAATLGSVIKGTKMQQKPLWRFQEEIPGIIESNIIPMLQNLKSTQSSLEESLKTKVTLVTANRDRTFSPDKIEENLKNAANEPDTPEAFFGDAIDSYVMFSKPEAGHEAIIYENPGLSAQIVNEKFQSKPDTGEVK